MSLQENSKGTLQLQITEILMLPGLLKVEILMFKTYFDVILWCNNHLN